MDHARGVWTASELGISRLGVGGLWQGGCWHWRGPGVGGREGEHAGHCGAAGAGGGVDRRPVEPPRRCTAAHTEAVAAPDMAYSAALFSEAEAIPDLPQIHPWGRNAPEGANLAVETLASYVNLTGLTLPPLRGRDGRVQPGDGGRVLGRRCNLDWCPASRGSRPLRDAARGGAAAAAGAPPAARTAF